MTQRKNASPSTWIFLFGKSNGGELAGKRAARAGASKLAEFAPLAELRGTTYCHPTYDSFLCWPPTPAGDVSTQNCPPARLSDTSRLAFRRCGKHGLWLGRRPSESSEVGWTNYTPCFPPEVQKLFIQVYDEDTGHAQDKFEIAQYTRNLEIVGFSISLIALLISLFIFNRFPSLRNNRTRIHKSLFIAMILQVVIRLILYIDQAFNPGAGIIYNVPYLCEIIYLLLEYAVSVMFMWMLIEGLYLHNVVTANALRERISHVVYYFVGWGVPLLVTAIWATTTIYHYQGETVSKCWYGYNFSPLYWIMQGPRLAVIIINMVFLLNILRVLILKLRRTVNSEVEKVRKAVRAALVLLPLLGITNILNMVEAPLGGGVWEFGFWSYITHFLRSFQGFFIALIYCFLNGEVRQVLRKQYNDYMAMRSDPRLHQESALRRFGFWPFGREILKEELAGARALNRNNDVEANGRSRPALMRVVRFHLENELNEFRINSIRRERQQKRQIPEFIEMSLLRAPDMLPGLRLGNTPTSTPAVTPTPVPTPSPCSMIENFDIEDFIMQDPQNNYTTDDTFKDEDFKDGDDMTLAHNIAQEVQAPLA